MNIRLINPESRTYRFLSIVLFYAFVLEITIPSAKAMGEILVASVPERTFVFPNVQESAKLETNDFPAQEQMPSVPSVAKMQTAAAGPGQTETSGFSLNTMDGMVDKFTGDFSYNIPLMDVEGYPITLSYSSNIGMHDEASWVGLGWNLNVGSIAREMRGIPDEFDGSQKITRTYSMAPDKISKGTKAGIIGGFSYSLTEEQLEAGDKLKLGASADLTLLWGKYENPYTGRSKTFDFGLQGKLSYGDPLYFGGKFSLGYNADSKNGIGRSTSVGLVGGYQQNSGVNSELGGFYGTHYNSRAGVTSRSINLDISAGYIGSKFGVIGDVGIFGTSFKTGTITSVPRLEMSSHSKYNAYILDAKYSTRIGAWVFGIGAEVQTYSSTPEFVYTDNSAKTIQNPAFGYFHSEKRNSYTEGLNPVMDFNRERDQQFSEETKNLQFSFPTYDMFHVSGMGISASFRGQRHDVGTYHDGVNIAKSAGNSNNLRVGIHQVGSVFSLIAGYSYGRQEGDVKSSLWSDAGDLNFSDASGNLFFKGIGEPTAAKSGLLNELKGPVPVSIALTKPDDVSVGRSTTMRPKVGSSFTFGSSALNALDMQSPDVISNIYEPLTATAAIGMPLESYTTFSATPVKVPIARTGGMRASNHLSAIEITTAEGTRYQYGVPVYSIKQAEVAFATSQTTEDPLAPGLVGYSLLDAGTGNNSGISKLYDKTEVPAYASAFLITGMFSADYTDREGDGPTLDDPGSYYKINHTRAFSETNPYRWRFPVSGNTGAQSKGLFNKGLIATESDNMVNYSYGEKEIWYTHSVESKNFIAEFVLADREDAYPVVSEEGRIDDTKPLKYLYKINLYNRNERLTNAAAKPVQTVEFKYEYILCKGNPSNKNTYGGPSAKSGKLTLTEVRIYSGQSEETALAPYLFEYGTGDENPNFSYKNTDRWGKYKPNNASKPNDMFPYAEQVLADADLHARAWKLKKVTSPTGGEMEVTYESDSYSTVQDRRAMEHTDIKGYMTPVELLALSAQSSWSGTSTYITSDLRKSISDASLATMGNAVSAGWSSTSNYTNALKDIKNSWSSASNDLRAMNKDKSDVPANVVVVRLKTPITASTKADAHKQFRDIYLKDEKSDPIISGYIQELYLRNYVKIKNTANLFEAIPTFANIDQGNVEMNSHFPFAAVPSTGVLPPNSGGTYEYGYIVLETVESDEPKKDKNIVYMHPVQKTAMEFARLHLTDIVYGSCPSCDTELGTSLDKITFWNGDLYKHMSDFGYCNVVDLTRSTARLMDHDNLKYGGNARVSQITYKDRWNYMSGEYLGEYKWKYNYGTGKTFGVAAYEPQIGNDENPFYRWDTYKNKSKSFPDETRFTEDPAGASLFPAPVVGYSEVAVELVGNPVAEYIGKSITNFYTAADYPTYTESTLMEKIKAEKNNFVNEELYIYGLSQGHVVVTNDYHGKIKSHSVKNGSGDVQEMTEYFYRSGLDGVKTLDRDGTLLTEKISTEFDAHLDTRFIRSEASSWSVGLTGSFPLPFFIPFILFPSFSRSERTTGFYVSVLNKHINYAAVLERITTNELGSKNSAENLVFDRYSGNVVLSSLKDEFNDQIYSIQFPAHWHYKNFQSPKMHTFAPLAGTVTGGVFTYASSLTEKLLVGDLVSVAGTTTVQAHVLSISGSTAKLITGSGSSISLTGACTVSLLKSGRKNRLMETMQSLNSMRNPLATPGIFTFPAATAVGVASAVINISAMSFKERYNVQCIGAGETQKFINGVPVNTVINPFRYGLKCNLVFENQYLLQTERNSSQVQGIRYNGTLTEYKPYYELNPTDKKWYRITGTHKWRPTGEITTFDEFGRPIDSRNQLKIGSAVLYGYSKLHKLVPIAQAVNAQQHEIAFDGFEDYEYALGAPTSLDLGHFDFSAAQSANVSLTATEKHSGLKSLKINPGNTASVTRTILADCAIPANGLTDGVYSVNNCMCIRPFSPKPGTYIIGAWVKAATVSAGMVYTAPTIKVEAYNGSAWTTISVWSAVPAPIPPSGKIIEGWQRAEGEFTITSAMSQVRVSLINNSATESAYFDDVRIHPFLAGMTTTVYDPKTLLPMATHDGYNFTTFYNYDENLTPVRVKVETVEGIKTITETETSIIKKYK